MQVKYVVLLAVVSAAIGAGVTRAYFTRETIKTIEKQVTKDHVVTVIRNVKDKNGTESTLTTITEDRAVTDNKKVVDKKAAVAPNWNVSAGVGMTVNGLPSYELSIQRRLVGPLFIGVTATTQKEGFVTLGLEF